MIKKDSILTLASVSLLGSVFGRGLRYLLNIFIARGLGAEALGIFAYVLVVMKATSIIARMGLDVAAKRYIPIHHDNDSIVAGIVLLTTFIPLVLGCILGLGVLLSSEFIDEIVNNSFGMTGRILTIGIPLYATLLASVGLFRGFKRPEYGVYVRDIVQSGIAALGILLAVTLTNSLQIVAFVYIGSLIVSIVVAGVLLLRLTTLSAIKTPIFKTREYLVFALPLVGIAVIQYIVSWTDIIILGIYSPSSNIGRYQAAFQTSILLLIVIQAANSVFPPLAAERYERDEIESLYLLFKGVTKWVTYLTALCFLFLLLYRSTILSIFGSEFRNTELVLVVLAFGQFLVAATGPVGTLLTMTNHERVDLFNTVFVSLLNIILNLYLVQRYGILGAAAATAFALFLLNLLRLLEVKWILGIQPYSSDYITGVISLAFSFLFVNLSKFIPTEGVVSMVLGISIGSIAFFIMIQILGIRQEDYLLLDSIRNR